MSSLFLKTSIQNNLALGKKKKKGKEIVLITNGKLFRLQFEAKWVITHIYTVGKNSRWNKLNKQERWKSSEELVWNRLFVIHLEG